MSNKVKYILGIGTAVLLLVISVACIVTVLKFRTQTFQFTMQMPTTQTAQETVE